MSEYLDAVGKLESNNNYLAKNRFGYLGRYQIGKIALTDLGYIKNGKWVGKDGLDSEEEFLSSKKLQDRIMKKYTNRNRMYLKSKGVLKYIGTKFKGIKVTLSGLLGASHLLGAGGVSRMLKTGIIGKDANGTKGTRYLKELQSIKM